MSEHPMTTTATAASARPDIRQRPTLLMLRWSVLPTLTVAPVIALVTWAMTDLVTGASVLVGAVLSILVFALGVVAVRGLLSGPGAGAMAGAFAVLFAQLGLTLGAFLLVDRASPLETVVVGVSFVLVGIVFQGGLAVGALRARITLTTAGVEDGSVRRDVDEDAEVSEE
ncbi:hypothetical protein [Serinicoccus sp. LYQ131]|uniref:hypothetical protein n=1 Tax=Serinicoccus sp. LYQ131 TaxID=3378797 RepID=UPI0038543564